MWKNIMSSETARGLSASIQQASENIAKKAEEAQDVDTPLGARLSSNWKSVVEATKNAVDETRKVVEKEQSRLFDVNKKPVKRDVTLPLDVEALRDAEVVYITERIITMSHPALQSQVDESITPNRKLAAVAHLLDRRHGGRYMVWNLSEVEYDVDILDDQVLTFSFPGSPSPPLGLLLKLLMSMESWLKADERNVAVVHCLTGKGRTSTVLAAFLCWIGEAGFSNVQDALEYIAQCKKLTAEQLTIPSQRRYVKYFANMLDGVRPSQPPIMLKRVIMSESPKFAKGPPLQDSETPLDEDSLMGCAPYIQIFKSGKLLFTTAATVSYQQEQQELPFCHVAQGSVSFHVEQVLQGDVLIRSRHLTATGQPVSMFRTAIHTGYVPPKVMRLSKGELDGACNDKRFGQDFFLDLIFEPCDAEMASQHLSNHSKGKLETDDAETNEQDGDENETKDDEKQDSVSDEKSVKSETIVTASVDDGMLHRDSRFWDVIAERREQHSHHEDQDEVDPMWGPTIGRKRDLTSKAKGFAEKKSGKPSKDQSSALQTFSIGGDLDFFDAASTPSAQDQTSEEPKRDELMEALMALDDDPVSPPSSQVQSKYDEVSATPLNDEIEEIVFESASDEPDALVPTNVKEPPATVVDIPPPKNEGPSEVVVETKPAVGDANVATKDVTSESEPSKEPSMAETEVEPANTTSMSAVDEATADLLKDADLDMDADLDALLASADDQDTDLPDDLNDLDFDDEDLMDLEKMLSTTK